MFSTRTRNRGLALASAVLLLGACEDDAGRGALIVPFKLGNHRHCSEFDVDRVYGELGDGEEHYDDVKCEAGKLTMGQVPEGTYQLRLYGYDNDEVPVMDSLNREHLTVNVFGGETILVEPDVMLTPSPANLKLRWTFGFGSCQSAGIDKFLIDVWRADGSDLLLEYEMDCEKIGDEDEYYRDVPDPKRGLSGWAVGEVTIQALGEDGAEVGDPLEFEFDAPGPGRDIKLSFACEEESCSCSGRPD